MMVSAELLESLEQELFCSCSLIIPLRTYYKSDHERGQGRPIVLWIGGSLFIIVGKRTLLFHEVGPIGVHTSLSRCLSEFL